MQFLLVFYYKKVFRKTKANPQFGLFIVWKLIGRFHV
jgi:hypothetical protein